MPHPPALAGFGASPSEPVSGQYSTSGRTLSEELVDRLHELGVRDAFGLIGGANAAFADALGRSPIRVIHCRHESGAGFAAAEAYFASGAPALVFATTGPGLLNALNGVVAARWEGAKLILVSGVTSAAQRGRGAAQETSASTMPYSGFFTQGPLFHYATVIESVEQLATALARLKGGLESPGGFVAHIALPIASQRAGVSGRTPLPDIRRPRQGLSADALARSVEALAAGRFAIWVGFGARHHAQKLRDLAALTNAPVMCTPRAKGIFPEDHSAYLGVTGLGGHERVYDALESYAPERVLVLGTKMGEGSSFWSPRLVPKKGFVHVDIDPEAFGAAYPEAPTLGVQAEIGVFLDALLERASSFPRRSCAKRFPSMRVALAERAGRVRTSYLMQEFQRIVVASSDSIVMADSGNAFAWGNQCLSFRDAGRYRVSVGYGSMGHFTAGALGAALASGRRTVALVGDGAMLMNNEINTAVQYGAPAVWVVLNDGRYGMVEQGMRALGYQPVEAEFPEVDFVAVARAMGADGVHAREESEVAAALRWALSADGPVVVDVSIDGNEPSPVLMRVKSLIRQGAAALPRNVG